MSFVRKLTKSRETVLDMLALRGGDVKPYENFSTEEINVMYKNSTKTSKDFNPIDFNVSAGDNKIYVKYLFNSKPRVANLITLVETLVDESIEDGDSLIMLIKDNLTNDQSLEIFLKNFIKAEKYCSIF